MKKLITVFTPSYNRAYTIHKLYDSLVTQKNRNFEWLVVDDGSTDNTRELIESYIKESDFHIRYIYKENGGMVSAHNTAYDNIHTELCVCIDSDDYLTNDAIDIIQKYWSKHKSDDLSGLLGLDIYENGEILGIEFPEHLSRVKFTELKEKYGDIGDKKFVMRTDVINEFPRFPEYKNEKFPAVGLLYRKIDTKYYFLAINEKLCVVEYLEDGNSKNKIKQYINNPNAFADYRIERLKLDKKITDIIKNAIHYVSSKFIAKKPIITKETPYKFIVALVIPFGFLLSIYIRNTKKKGFK